MIPQSYIDEGMELASGCFLFGERVATLTREQAIAALAQACRSERLMRDQHMRAMRVLSDLHRR